jgi:hypothetical protein
MKRYIFIIVIFASAFAVNAQNQVDALRYSYLDPTGTARFTAMGGAFSSLGGDFSAISINPAGLGVYRSSEFTITPSIVYTGANSKFMGNTESDFNYNISLGNLGYVGTVLFEEENSKLKSLSFGFGYNNLNNFNEMIEIEGVNAINSMTDHLAARTYGINSDDFDGFYLSPAWETYLINPNPDDVQGYVSALDARGQVQRMDIQRKGHLGEYVFSAGVNLDNQVYFGGSFGIQNVNFEQTIFYSENDTDDMITDFKSFNYTEHIDVDGTGYNFKLGAIFRPVDWLRVSTAIHTPTFYNLYDEYSTDFSSVFADTSHLYQSGLGVYDYNITSPFTAIGGLSFIILNQGLISVDYEFLDYSISKLRGDDYSFSEENNAIESSYIASNNLRIGAEYKLGPLALRGGWTYSTSPFGNEQLNADMDVMKFSGGFGFRSQDFFFDMAYVYQDKSEKYLMYEGFGLDAPETEIQRTRHTVLATIGFRF